MSRPLRIEFENAFYHVISRGVRGEIIFSNAEDKKKFLNKLNVVTTKWHWKVHAYVLMNNHYHLLVETPLANLSQAMHQLNTSYGNWYRKRAELIGSIFQGRYKAILVDKDEYLKVLSAYIHLNPVRAGIVEDPVSFPFSSCRYYCGQVGAPSFLHLHELSALFSGPEEYREFLHGYKDDGRELARAEAYGKNSLLGSNEFLRKVFRKLKKSGTEVSGRETPSSKPMRQVSIEDILECLIAEMNLPEEMIWKKGSRGNIPRKLAIYGMNRYTRLGLSEIGTLFDMDYAAVSAMVNRFEKELLEKPKLTQLAHTLEQRVNRRRISQQ
ncbi:MAG TPA: transposase [Candidatus Sumerlaeota bacterium]|nr:transposase [Candidatus Sumerlaeota bacterium]